MSSNVHFITSKCFPKSEENSVKIVISRASAEDIATAHKDIYCCSMENAEPEFTVEKSLTVKDSNLFASYLKKIDKRICHTFYEGGARQQLEKIVDAVNALSQLCSEDKLECEKCDELVVSEDVASFDLKMCTEIEPMQQDGRIMTDTVNAEECFVPTVPVLEIKYPDAALNDWTPQYNEFVIFNKGYGFLLQGIREVFPEFTIVAHENFPKCDLAEQMLFYQIGLTSEEHHFAGSMDASAMIEKVRVFFGCSLNKGGKEQKEQKEQQKSSFKEWLFSESEMAPKFPEIVNVNDVSFGVPLQDSFKMDAPPSKNFYVERIVPQYESLRNKDRKDMSSQSSTTPDNFNCLDEEQFASPFRVEPSPCMDAFVSKEKTWGRETRNPIPNHLNALYRPTTVGKPGQNEQSKLAESTWNNSDAKVTMSDVTIHADRRLVLQEFIGKKCHKFRGAKVKSSRLFDIFKMYYEEKQLPVPFGKVYNQTCFTMLMKQLSTFETKREKDGMYWVDLHLGDAKPKTMREKDEEMENNEQVEIDADQEDDGSSSNMVVINGEDEDDEVPPNAITFAELFNKKTAMQSPS